MFSRAKVEVRFPGERVKILSALKAGRFPSGDCEGQPVSALEPAPPLHATRKAQAGRFSNNPFTLMPHTPPTSL